MAAGEKTEKATPKKRDDARKKGQVARSMDLNGAVVVLAGLLALGTFGPGMVERLRVSMHETLALTSTPGVVSQGGLSALAASTALTAALVTAPVALLCLTAGVLTNVGQVRWKPSAHALKPDLKRLNPISGAKNLFGPHALFEGGKSLVKVAAVGAIAALAVFPELGQLAALVGLPAAALGAKLVDMVSGIALRAAVAYLAIGVVDLFYQRWRHEKQLRMDKEEVKEEAKGQQVPAEVKGALRRRQMLAARARMMDAVPQADVVVTNPTHFAVALAYDGQKTAPEVVAKGQDLIAAQIRRLAEEHGVPVVPDPPLARSLHAGVEVGQQIPEDFFQAVAQLLAFVYRTAGRRRGDGADGGEL